MILVIGGGIVGISTCYYLSKQGIQVTLIEKEEIACAASGKAGGFLGKDWGNRETSELHRKGFELHEELAKELSIESFRYLPTMSLSHTKKNSKSCSNGPNYLNKDKTSIEIMDNATAQVTPKELCVKMFEKATSMGAIFIQGKATGIDHESKIVKLSDGQAISFSSVVLTMGPWTCEAESWLNGLSIPMQGIKSSSVIIRPSSVSVDGVALFCEEDRNDCHLEVYPRPDSTVYLCGLGNSPHLGKNEITQLKASEVLPDNQRVEKAIDSFRDICEKSVMETFTFESQACMRPILTDAKPMIGRIPGSDVYIGAGHNCWGILWGPITGQALADLIANGSSSINLKPFNPLRFHSK